MGSDDFLLVQSQGNGYPPDGVRKVFDGPQLAPILNQLTIMDDWVTLSKKIDKIIASIPNENRSTGSKNTTTEPGY